MGNDLNNNQRQIIRTTSSLPIKLMFGTQITLEGQLKDLSLKSAFIKIKESIFMQPNDELNFSIPHSRNGVNEPVEGSGRVSRIAAGEGIAIYFTKMDDDSSTRLKELIGIK